MNQLWLGRRFVRNQHGNFEAWAKAHTDSVCIEVDGRFAVPEDPSPENVLLKLHQHVQSAARANWEAGDVEPVSHSFSGRLDHYRIRLAEDDLRSFA